MRQSITTKYIGPTNFRGSRIKATAEAGSVTLSYDHALSSEENHCAAAKALAEKFDWQGVWVGGASRLTRTFVNVCSAHTEETRKQAEQIAGTLSGHYYSRDGHDHFTLIGEVKP